MTVGIVGLGYVGLPLAADVAVIVTAHPDIDHAALVDAAPLTVDLRGATVGLEGPNLVRL